MKNETFGNVVIITSIIPMFIIARIYNDRSCVSALVRKFRNREALNSDEYTCMHSGETKQPSVRWWRRRHVKIGA